MDVPRTPGAERGGAIIHQRVPTAVLVLVSVVVLAACGGGSSATTRPASFIPSTSPTSPTPSPVPTPLPSETPETSATSPEPTEFALPTPACPSPAKAVAVPDVTVSVGDSPGIVATKGSSTIETCSTTGAIDAAPTDPEVGLQARAGDVLHLALPSGWRFLRWEGYDRPVAGEGANVWPPVDTPERPDRIDAPVPTRTGDSIVGYTLWLTTSDQRAVGQIDVLVRVSVGG